MEQNIAGIQLCHMVGHLERVETEGALLWRLESWRSRLYPGNDLRISNVDIVTLESKAAGRKNRDCKYGVYAQHLQYEPYSRGIEVIVGTFCSIGPAL